MTPLEIFKQYAFREQREKFRQENQARVHKRLVPTVQKICDGTYALYWLDPEAHPDKALSLCTWGETPEFVLPKKDEAKWWERLERDARGFELSEAADFDGEAKAFDGPPIQDVTDEVQVLAAIDEMIAAGEENG